MTMSTTRRRLSVIAASAGAGVLLFAGSAAAHVTVQPGTADQGSYAKVAFRVPNERDDAGTTKLEVTLPADKPLTSVQTRAMPGWKAEVEKTKLTTPIDNHGKPLTEVVSKITWTADAGTRVNPGTFEDFEVSMGKLPTDTDKLVFKAVQTYDSGEVVRWIDLAGADGKEPQYPAPVLKLTPKAGASAPSAPAAAAATKPADGKASVAAVADDKSDDSTARTLGVVGIVVGVLGLGAGLFAVLRASRRPGSA
ncbi:YcnI family copper-binding membrane protein [Embleya hyalina]|uniref:Membrane protein n=1 Tax=Embleya hyalina TaxID=516124 RepID=A0A401YUK8_9ACTN|nr:YcnI family protein [Embleya hyalina]GCD98261.1 membrane protein [Embleya hyalina]